MKSGLEGRNNEDACPASIRPPTSLNEVRPRRPEQFDLPRRQGFAVEVVSMKSSLEGRNNATAAGSVWSSAQGVSMKSGLEGRNNTGTPSWTGASGGGLNEVRPSRPEQ